MISLKYFLIKVRDVKLMDVLSIFPMILAFILSPFFKRKYKNTWLITEEKYEARDNGYWFFKNITEKHPEQKCIYEKVQIFRLLKDGQMERGSAIKKYVDETFHVQNDYLFQLNPREYELVPQHIIDFCDSEIEKLANRPQ